MKVKVLHYESKSVNLLPRRRLSVCWFLPTHNSHPSLMPFSHPYPAGPSLMSNFPIFKISQPRCYILLSEGVVFWEEAICFIISSILAPHKSPLTSIFSLGIFSSSSKFGWFYWFNHLVLTPLLYCVQCFMHRSVFVSSIRSSFRNFACSHFCISQLFEIT